MKRYISIMEDRLSNYKDNMLLYSKLFNDSKEGLKESIQEIDSLLRRKNDIRNIKLGYDCIIVEYKDNKTDRVRDKYSIEIIRDILQDKSMVTYGVLDRDRFENQLCQTLDERFIMDNLSSILGKIDKVSIDSKSFKVLLKSTENGDEVVHSFNSKELRDAIQVCIKKNTIARGDVNVNSHRNK